MAKDIKLRGKEAYRNYISDCLAWEDDPEFYIHLVRKMAMKRNFEDILKTTITFMKRHEDKLGELTSGELSDIHMELREYMNRPKEPLKPFRKAAAKVATIKKD